MYLGIVPKYETITGNSESKADGLFVPENHSKCHPRCHSKTVRYTYCVWWNHGHTRNGYNNRYNPPQGVRSMYVRQLDR